MKDPVRIKGNSHGINIVVDDSADFEKVRKSLIDKISKSADYFGDSDVIVTFSGKKLQEDEEIKLIGIIEAYSRLKVICIATDSSENRQTKVDLLQQIENSKLKEDASDINFYYSTLRSGQCIESNNSIVVVGDVNNGAVINSGGHVIILGVLKGVVHAGINLGEHSFVFALDMKPIQLSIGKVYARAADDNIKKNTRKKESKKNTRKKESKIAYVNNDRIVLESLNQDVYKLLKNKLVE